MGKTKTHAYAITNLLTDEEAAFIERFYEAKKARRLIFLLLEHPKTFTEIIYKAGSALLFYDLGCIDKIIGTSDKQVILNHITYNEWLWYLQKNKIRSVDSDKVPQAFKTKFILKKKDINSRLLMQRLGRYTTLTTSSLRRIGHSADFQTREDINALLAQRGEAKLKPIKLSLNERVTRDKESYLKAGYNLKSESIKKYIVKNKIRSFSDLHSKNSYLINVLKNKNYPEKSKTKIYMELINEKFWNTQSFKKHNQSPPLIPHSVRIFLDQKSEALS